MKTHLAVLVALLSTTACSTATTPDRDGPVPIALDDGGTNTKHTGVSGDDDDDDDDASPSGDDDADGGSRGDGSTTPGSDGGGGGTAKPDWQDLYTEYFAASTVGHCGNSTCHASGAGGFTSGTTADSMYQGMISKGLLDADDPTASVLAVAGKTPLAWYGQGGAMPLDGAKANEAAAAAVTAWVAAGALNHGIGPGGQTSDAGADAGPGDAGADASTDAGSDAGHDAGSDAGSDAGVDAGPAVTFTDVYESWIGPNTPGHCGNSFCHKDSGSTGSKASGFVCGTTQSACFSGLVAGGLISTTDPKSSALADPTTTPLSWYGEGGGMPVDEKGTNAAGAAAITAWVNAGAKND